MMVHDTGAFDGGTKPQSAEQPSLDGLPSSQDWATIWQSELAALAVDRECNEGFLAWGQAWVTAFDAPAGRTGPDAPPRGRARWGCTWC